MGIKAMNSLSVDNVQVSFEDIMSTVGDLDKVLKAYLFRGWFLTEIVNGGRIDIEKCPCCGHFLKKNETLNKQETQR